MLKKIICFFLFFGVASNSFGMTEGRVAQICTAIIKKTGNSVDWGKVASAGITQVCGVSAFCFKAAWNQFGFSLLPTVACAFLVKKVYHLESKLDVVDKTTKRIDVTTQDTHKKVDAIKGQMDTLSADVVETKETTKAVAENVKDLKTKFKDLRQEFADGFKELYKKHGIVVAAVKGVKDVVDKARESLDSVLLQLEKSQEWQSKFEAKYDAGQEATQQMITGISIQQKTLTQQQDKRFTVLDRRVQEAIMNQSENEAKLEKMSRRLEKMCEYMKEGKNHLAGIEFVCSGFFGGCMPKSVAIPGGGCFKMNNSRGLINFHKNAKVPLSLSRKPAQFFKRSPSYQLN